MYEGFAQNASILPHTSYHIGGKAKFLARVSNLDELLRAFELCENRLILGRGSKVLVSDKGFDGVVVLMRMTDIKFCLNEHKTKSQNTTVGDRSNKMSTGVAFGSKSDHDFGAADCPVGTVYAEAGVSLPVLSRLYANKALSGLEWACGIPASVGGALRLNAGAYGGDMSQVVNYVDILRKGKQIRLFQKECGFFYRGSGFLCDDVILGAEFVCQKGDRSEIARAMAIFGEKRAAAQPAGFSCGSVFKADERPAYTYIQKCGLKGLFIGDARLSEKHGNFILNCGFAKARQVYNLIRTIKAEVFAALGIALKEEVVYVGEF